jgi:DNA-binding MarR family transcriptional regulator
MKTSSPGRRVVAGPALHRGDEGGPLSRELMTVKLVRLVDFLSRAASLAFPRVSGLSDFEWRVVAWSCETPGLSINDLASLLHRGAAQVSRTVKKLVAARLLDRVSRRGGPGVRISPTPLGRTVYGPLAALARQRNAEIISGLAPREIRLLERSIATMMANVLAQLAREQELQAQARRNTERQTLNRARAGAATVRRAARSTSAPRKRR